jgi:hypothetical protein
MLSFYKKVEVEVGKDRPSRRVCGAAGESPAATAHSIFKMFELRCFSRVAFCFRQHAAQAT